MAVIRSIRSGSAGLNEEDRLKIANLLVKAGYSVKIGYREIPGNAMNVIAQFSDGTVTELRYAGNGIFEGIYEYSTRVIIAWMPLPEPYEGE